jgi:ElaB/YqjD/DUF883 family membrane-anchored ribosome-binding protein
MLITTNGTGGKKDLHVGGLDTASSANLPSASLASMIDPLVDASENWVEKARDFVSSADDYVRNNPWQALGVMAILGVTLGFLMSRRS